jgi:hypothetical protein
VFKDVMHDLAEQKNRNSIILQYDGKLLRNKLTASHGDADYAGMEKPV